MKLKLSVLLAFIAVSTAGDLFGQTQTRGISSDGRDFFIGYMPGIRHPGGWTGYSENYYVLICSYQDNNPVTLYYFGQDGTESQGPTKILTRGRCEPILLDKSQMQPSRPGESLEFKAVQIRSRFPVSVQCYDEGSSTGGMYQAIPTCALGKSYVVASWFDNPIQNNPSFQTRDSSSSEFMIIAPYDNTTVTFIPTTTTYGSVPGYKTGTGSDGMPHPRTIAMRRGQVYWVRSQSNDPTNDMSGSSVTADKPIAVLGGQERALLGDPAGVWPSLDGDIRDVMIEQMTPVEDWGSDYPSIPFMPANGAGPRFNYLLKAGEGNMYRVFSNDPSGITANLLKGFPPQAYTSLVGRYQYPAVQYDNIVDPVDLLVDAGSVDSNGAVKKMYVVMYDYFQGAHDTAPGGLANTGKSGSKAQSNGGDNAQDETTYKMPNEMDLVPIDRWRMNTIFKIPQNSTYRGYQFINIITNKDALPSIFVTFNGLPPKTLSSIATAKTYSIPSHPELTGLTLKLAPGDYLINGNTPFACYSYGRTETQYKDGWGYAAPCGQWYGSRSESVAPKADVTFSCNGWDLHWDVRVHNSLPNEGGIADILMLNDSDGFYSKPGRTSINVLSDELYPQFGIASSFFTPGDSSVKFQIYVRDLTKDAKAAIYIVDRAGNDTVIELHYTAPVVTITPISFDFKNVLVGTQVCATFSVKNPSINASVIGTPQWILNDMSNYGKDASRKSATFSWSSSSVFPVVLRPSDSLMVTVCFAPTDTNDRYDTAHHWHNGHQDFLQMPVDCTFDTIPVTGKGITPIINAIDLDFGYVRQGDSICKVLTVRNEGNAPLILDTNWKLGNNPDFTFMDHSLLPDTLQPSQSSKLMICFHPRTVGISASRLDWHTNIPDEYAHQKKDSSMLTGNARSGVSLPEQNSLSLDAITPNPSDKLLTVTFYSIGAARIQLFDVLGHEVLSKALVGSGSQSLRLDIPALPSGTYFVRLSSEGLAKTARFEIR